MTLAALVVSIGNKTASGDDEKSFDLSIMTFNVLVDLGKADGVPVWKDRRDLCVQVIKESGADLVGLQEPVPAQVKFLLAELHQYTAIYYDQTKTGYTDATLLYKTGVFDLVERGHWWLSPTPDRVSVGFGNVLPRIVVWARLKHRSTGRELFAIDTHFDNSMPSQVKMAELCQQKLAALVEQGLPMFFFGDFNTDQKRGDYARLTSGGWRDSYVVSEHATADGRDDNITTMVDGQKRIDHIFFHGEWIEPVTWRRLESPDPERKLSDHYPVQATFRVR